MLTFRHLKTIASPTADESNIRSIITGLDTAPPRFGLRLPHRYVHFAAQVAHESGRFRYDEEVWGPTPAQLRYDLRADLGNTPTKDGDGFLYRGRTGMQATGKANYDQFTRWCRANGFPHAPDFVANPDLINTDPWEGLFPIFFWVTRKLNGFADANDIEMITRRINGGLNGYADRITCYNNLGLVVLDFAPNKDGIYELQRLAQRKGLLPPDTKEATQVDGVAGPKTRAALHELLVEKGKRSGVPSDVGGMPVTRPSPVVVEHEVEVAVIPEKADKTLLQRISGLVGILAPIGAWAASTFANLDQTGVLILCGIGVAGGVVLLWRGELIARRAKAIIKELES